MSARPTQMILFKYHYKIKQFLKPHLCYVLIISASLSLTLSHTRKTLVSEKDPIIIASEIEVI